jgi:CubicO group peptidase (beta-lactamase class C family)
MLALILAASIAAPRHIPPALDAYIEAARVKANVPGLAIAIVDADGIVAAKGYGVRRLGSPELVDGDTQFDIASLAKSFTTAMLATLVDEGKLRWDDRVRDVLPDISFGDPYLDANVTLRDLLTHRVALQAGNFMMRFTGYDSAEVLRPVRFLKPQGSFRADFVYSNVDYAIAGAMAEKVSGKSWSALVRERLLMPLGMNATNSDEELNGANKASPHAIIDDVQQPVRHFRFTNIAPASGIVTTARDMATWLRFHAGDGTWNGKRIISEAVMAELHSPHFIIPTTPAMRAARNVEYFAGYALGWQVFDYRGHLMMWHSGNADGMPSYMAVLPKEKLGVIVMSNSWVTPLLHGALASRILDMFLGVEPRDYAAETIAADQRANAQAAVAEAEAEKNRVHDSHPTLALAQYAGTYVDPLHGDLTITLEGDHLTLQFARGERADLKHWQYDTFEVRWRDPVFRTYISALATFGLNAEGKASRLEMRLNRDSIDARRK